MLMELEREAAEGMGSRVETFEQIRRDRDREGLSIRALAERHGVHRRAVRQALAAPLPPVKRKPVSRPAPKLGAYRELIDSWLDADRDAPRKQRHTARRIWERLRDEHAADVAERTVREYVHGRRRERGEGVQAFVPQAHEAGVEAEVDWGEAHVAMAGAASRVYLFHMRACHSGAAFAMAFPHCSQQAFLEAHVLAFEWFGGVFGLLRYDNLASAVKQVLRGRRRVESDRFIALRSHYLYESQFTIAGIEGAHEKGGVEGEVGRFRRRHLVPVPDVATLGELNARILAGCESDLTRRIAGRQETVGESFARERPLLRGLPAERACTAEEATPRVDSKSLVTIKQNRYSVPVRLAGLRVHARVGAREIECHHGGELVACHERQQGRFGVSASLDHYLELIARKPGALRGSLALSQERERGCWPSVFDELWGKVTERYGASEGARQMVDVLMLAREHSAGEVELAVRGALTAGAHDGRAVAVLASRGARVKIPTLEDLPQRLQGLGAPPPTLDHYDELLVAGGAR
jgi:transposase